MKLNVCICDILKTPLTTNVHLLLHGIVCFLIFSLLPIKLTIKLLTQYLSFILYAQSLSIQSKYKPNYFNIGFVFQSDITRASSACSNHWRTICKHCGWALNWLFQLGLCWCPLSFFLRNLFCLAIGGPTTYKPANVHVQRHMYGARTNSF